MDKHGDNLFRYFDRKVLLKVFGPVPENRCSRRHKNYEIYKLYDEYNFAKFIKNGRFRWVGHVMNMEESDPANNVICTKP